MSTERRLARGDLLRPFHGVRTSRVIPATLAYSPLLRSGDRFSHTTAAALWGAPIPQARERDLHVTATRGQRPRSAGCIGHESVPVDEARRQGLPVSDPALTVMECASLLDTEELVAIIDHLVLDPRRLDPSDLRPYISLEHLGVILQASKTHGVVRARRAVRLARGGVESPMETRLRLLLVRAGVPEPICGYELRRPNGSTIGWFDLAWPDRRVIAEYDGDQHRTSTQQYERDIRRFDDAADAGWRVVRVRQRGILTTPGETIDRIGRALNLESVGNQRRSTRRLQV